MVVVENETKARQVCEYRERKEQETKIIKRASFEQAFESLKAGAQKVLSLVVKADTQGSLEAITGALEKLGNEEVRAKVVYGGVGAVTESDIHMAQISGAPVISFHVRATPQAKTMASREGIEMRYYSVIYALTEDVVAVLSGLLAPELREHTLGEAKIRQVFVVSKVGKIAGCIVTEGIIKRGCHLRVARDGNVVFEGKMASLRHFKDEAKEVRNGQECGIMLENFQDLREGDILEAFEIEERKRVLPTP